MCIIAVITSAPALGALLRLKRVFYPLAGIQSVPPHRSIMSADCSSRCRRAAHFKRHAEMLNLGKMSVQRQRNPNPIQNATSTTDD